MSDLELARRFYFEAVIARHVGHAQPSTTAGYVKQLGRRPKSVAERAADVLP